MHVSLRHASMENRTRHAAYASRPLPREPGRKNPLAVPSRDPFRPISKPSISYAFIAITTSRPERLIPIRPGSLISPRRRDATANNFPLSLFLTRPVHPFVNHFCVERAARAGEITRSVVTPRLTQAFRADKTIYVWAARFRVDVEG